MTTTTKIALLALAAVVTTAVAQEANRAQIRKIPTDRQAVKQQDQTDGIEVPGVLPESTDKSAEIRGPAPCRLEFIASFGDPDQVSGAPTNIDKNATYQWPTNGFPMPTTDTDIINSNKMRGFSITGYPRFEVRSVVEATLRVDVYLHMSDGLWSNDSLGVWDDSVSTTPGTALITGNSLTGELATTLTPFLQARHALNEQWVTFLFDLTPSSGHGVYVYGIDQYGRPDPARYYGLWKTITPATATRVLQAACDGDLHGYMQDDCPLSYAELVVKAN